MIVFLYLMDMYIDFQFILSSCGCIGNKCMMVVGLLLPRQTKRFVPVLYSGFDIACPRIVSDSRAYSCKYAQHASSHGLWGFS